jgi:hypothetical protein
MEQLFDFPIYFSPRNYIMFHDTMRARFPSAVNWTERFNESHVPTLRFEDYMENKNRYSRMFLEAKKRDNESRQLIFRYWRF